jgi:hypothetical protein
MNPTLLRVTNAYRTLSRTRSAYLARIEQAKTTPFIVHNWLR